MQAITLEIILRPSSASVRESGMDALRDALRDFLDLTTNPLLLAPVLLVGPKPSWRFPAFRRRIDASTS